jgi:hypothetical protein
MADFSLYEAGRHLGNLIVNDLTVKLTADKSWIGCFEWTVYRNGKVVIQGDGQYMRFQPFRQERIIPELVMDSHEHVVGDLRDAGLDAALAEKEASMEAGEGGGGYDKVFKAYVRLEPGPDRVLNVSNVGLHYNLRGRKLFTGMLAVFQEWSDTKAFCGYVMVQNVSNKRLREHLVKKDGWALDANETYKRKGLCTEDPSAVLIMDESSRMT